MPFRAIVEDGDCVPKVEKFLNTDAPDIAGSAGDEYIHRARA
jgi:hypothetical protein